MSSEDPLQLMADDDGFDKERTEIYFSTDMRCPVVDCDVHSKFPTKSKYSRHWEERHIEALEKFECAVQGCTTRQRRKSDMRSHMKNKHGERDSHHIENVIVKCSKVVERNKHYIPPGFLIYYGRTDKSVNFSKQDIPSVVTIPNATTTTVTLISPAVTATVTCPTAESGSSSLPVSLSTVAPSPMVICDALQAEEKEDDVEFQVRIPSSLPKTMTTSSTATSVTPVLCKSTSSVKTMLSI